MPIASNLEGVSTSQLRAELEFRSKSANKDTVSKQMGSALSELPTAALIDALVDHEKVIYGVDDRKDFFEFADSEKIVALTKAVAALFLDTDVVDNGDGTSKLQTRLLGPTLGLCAGQRFFDQPIGAFCTGFLVGPDLIATAGHCVNADNVKTVVFVFGYRMDDARSARTQIPNADIYLGAELIGRTQQDAGPDWSLVRLDRAVEGRKPLSVRRSGRIGDIAAVSVIGHPSGLPVKFADGANVRDNSPSGFFVANLDTFGGNSGSPVFNASGVVEGILVRGETDYVANGGCKVAKVCPSTGCRGEDCTRITELVHLIPVA